MRSDDRDAVLQGKLRAAAPPLDEQGSVARRPETVTLDQGDVQVCGLETVGQKLVVGGEGDPRTRIDPRQGGMQTRDDPFGRYLRRVQRM